MASTGAAKLGYAAKTAAQNYRDTSVASAGWSPFGDREQNKQGTLATFLVDAARAGAKLLSNCAVERVEAERQPDGRLRACGVRALVHDGKGGPSQRLYVRARRCVVVSAGSLQTPCILLRSGLRNPHVGRHLRLHPVSGAVGTFEGSALRMYEGAPMTTVCGHAEQGPGGDGYGAKIEVPSVHPGLMCADRPHNPTRWLYWLPPAL
eukprot:SAG11_NODE_3900_length_2158_cov_2.273919_1_plen_207_part_00